ncbi:MAG TPA: MFS transporter [Bryobacteraceae bacterium]|nr:MFS transporter [Bryobacteraceae bacterium]
MNLKPQWALIAFLWGCYVLNHADRQVVYTLFPPLQKEFGFDNAVLGLTGALFLWVYGLCSPAAGILGDRWSKTHLVVGSLAVWSTFTILSGLSPNGTFLLVCRGLLGVSESLFMPAAYALMANAHGPATRSKAIAIFSTSQMVGVAVGGSMSGYIAQHFHWRVSFWVLGAIGLLFSIPLARFFRTLPEQFHAGSGEKRQASGAASFFRLFRIPSLLILNIFIAVATFALFLVYTWLPTFLYDKFHLGLARAGFEASVYPQIGTLSGLMVGGWLADRFAVRVKSARFWMLVLAFTGAAPCIFWLGVGDTLGITRAAAMLFGFFAGFVSSNQAAAAFEVVPASLRASTVGVLNLLGASVSGFAPYLGGRARSTIGVDRLMGFTAALYTAAGLLLVFGTIRYFARDHAKARALDEVVR